MKCVRNWTSRQIEGTQYWQIDQCEKKKFAFIFSYAFVTLNRSIPNTLLLFRTLTEAPYNMYRVNLFPLNVYFLQWAWNCFCYLFSEPVLWHVYVYNNRMSGWPACQYYGKQNCVIKRIMGWQVEANLKGRHSKNPIATWSEYWINHFHLPVVVTDLNKGCCLCTILQLANTPVFV